jgi:hypothetical protein
MLPYSTACKAFEEFLIKSSNLSTSQSNIAVFSMLSMVVLVVPGHMDNMIYFQITYNVALISAGIWLIHRGIQRGISHYFFLGTATILLTALMRYIDLIGEYIGGAILFMGLAALLLGAAKYWKTQSIKVGNS